MSTTDVAVVVRLLAARGTLKSQAELGPVVRGLLDAGPALVWAEPTPARSRVEGFVGLWADHTGLLPLLDRGVKLDEARLFWADGWVHLVRDSGGVRWAAFREDQGLAPGSLPWPVPLEGREAQESWEGLHRQEQRVLLLRDRHRYGLGEVDVPENLRAVLYRRGTGLVGWRLTREEKS